MNISQAKSAGFSVRRHMLIDSLTKYKFLIILLLSVSSSLLHSHIGKNLQQCFFFSFWHSSSVFFHCHLKEIVLIQLLNCLWKKRIMVQMLHNVSSASLNSTPKATATILHSCKMEHCCVLLLLLPCISRRSKQTAPLPHCQCQSIIRP